MTGSVALTQKNLIALPNNTKYKKEYGGDEIQHILFKRPCNFGINNLNQLFGELSDDGKIIHLNNNRKQHCNKKSANVLRPELLNILLKNNPKGSHQGRPRTKK